MLTTLFPHIGKTPLLVINIILGLLLNILGLFLLTVVPPKARKYVVILVTFVSGFYFALEFLIPKKNIFTIWIPKLTDMQIVVSSFTVFLGIGNLFGIHGKNVLRKNENFYNSLAFFFGFFVILIAGLVRFHSPEGAVQDAGNVFFVIFFQGFQVSLQSSMFSLVAFYIVSASYRAFRIRSTETGLMMVAAVIIMLSLVPLGVSLTNWIPQSSWASFLRLERMGPWILSNPNMAVQRAIAFGIAVGSLAMGLRIWLSLEKGSFFDKQL